MMILSLSLLVGTYSDGKVPYDQPDLGTVLQTAATGMASTMFFYTSFIVSIPKDLDEAASIDGAGIFRTFFKIILPQLKPVTVTRLIMIAVGTWNNFCNADLSSHGRYESNGHSDREKIFHAVAGAVQNVPLACAMCAVALCRLLYFIFCFRKYH